MPNSKESFFDLLKDSEQLVELCNRHVINFILFYILNVIDIII